MHTNAISDASGQFDIKSFPFVEQDGNCDEQAEAEHFACTAQTALLRVLVQKFVQRGYFPAGQSVTLENRISEWWCSKREGLMPWNEAFRQTCCVEEDTEARRFLRHDLVLSFRRTNDAKTKAGIILEVLGFPSIERFLQEEGPGLFNFLGIGNAPMVDATAAEVQNEVTYASAVQ